MNPIGHSNVSRVPVVLSHHLTVDPIGWGEFVDGQLVITIDDSKTNASLYTLARDQRLKELHLGLFTMAIPMRDEPAQTNVFDIGEDLKLAPKIDTSEEEN